VRKPRALPAPATEIRRQRAPKLGDGVMNTVFLSTAAAAALGLLATLPAHAIPRTFVSGTGGGSACTRAAPCATFQAAHDATDAGGEVNCLDAGSFGTLIINRSITVDCTGTLGAIQINNGIAIRVQTDGIKVRLRNITIHGSKNLDQGIQLLAGSTLFVESCIFRGMSANGSIIVNPLPSTTAKVFVSDSMFADNPIGGIHIGPNAPMSVRMAIDGTRFERGGIGLATQLDFTGSSVIAHVRNSVFSKNSIGINAATGNSLASITVDRTSFTFNDTGIQTPGASSFVIVGRSTLVPNNTGLNPLSGHILSYQNNRIAGNVTDGAPTGTLTLK
jgi:hypothetical protein